MDPSPSLPIYHVLLVGIDEYPPGCNSLTGCVNDIDAIEALLLDPPGIGLPPGQIRVTRLASQRPSRPSSTRYGDQTLAPTKANLVQALKSLAGPQVASTDRVLIYYSGHGKESTWEGSRVWHEALTPHDGRQIDFLYDVELNALVNAITTRTKDLTIVLDCCHSGGITRAVEEDAPEGGIDRSLEGEFSPGPPPDLDLLDPTAAGNPSAHMLQGLDPDYLAVVACLSAEKAGEGAYPGESRPLGVLTYCLVQLLKDMDAGQRAGLRWADVWPQLLEKTGQRCKQIGRRRQSPWLIGRSERRLFGGAWEPQDAGYAVTRRPDGRYRIGAGSLMGLTRAAEVAVYGPTPLRFPPIGSPEDRPLGCLKAVEVEPAFSTAVATGSDFALPAGARGRLVKPGESQRLRVLLKPQDTALVQELGQSPLLDLSPADASQAEVEVVALLDGGWIIGNDVEAAVARVPPGESDVLLAALEAYYRYQTALRMARTCNDPQLSRCLSIRLLDCSNPVALAGLTARQLADPPLPEAGRDRLGIYTVQPETPLCIKVTNTASYTLQVTLWDCSAGGLVEYMGAATLKKDAAQVFWFRDEVGRGFPVTPDPLPLLPGQPEPPPFVTDRLLAIGTTRRDADLNGLRVDRMLQQVIDDLLVRSADDRAMTRDATVVSSAPAELWTAALTPLRIATRIMA